MASPINVRRLGTAVVAVAISAALFWFGNGLNPLWPLLWFMPLPLLLFARRGSWWATGLAAWLAIMLGGLTMWHYAHVVHFPWFSIYAGMALLFALAVLLFRGLLRRGAYWTALLAFPAVWVSGFYLLSRTSSGGTAGALAYTQLKLLPLLQLASVTGPWGITFLLLLFPAALALAWHLCWRGPQRGCAARPADARAGSGARGPDPALRVAGAAPAFLPEGANAVQARQILAVSLGLIVAALVFGWVRLAATPPAARVRVGLIASDLGANDSVADAGAPAETLIAAYVAHAQDLVHQGAQAIVMPEKLAVYAPSDAAAIDQTLQAFANGAHVRVVAGFVTLAGARKYNQARVYAPGVPVRTYDKEHLLPIFQKSFALGSQLLLLPDKVARHFLPGSLPLVARSAGVDARQGSPADAQGSSKLPPAAPWGVAICKDMDFTRPAERYGQRQVGLLLDPAWDFGLDRTFHGHIAIMRSLEDGFNLAHAAKDGWLTVSDTRGRILAQTASNAAPFAMLVADVPANHVPTLYLVLGDWAAWLAMALAAFALAQLFRLSGHAQLAELAAPEAVSKAR